MSAVPWLTLALVLLFALVYAAGAAMGGAWGALGPETLDRLGTLRLPLRGPRDLLRLVSSLAVHVTPLHLLGNSALLLCAGAAIERRRGWQALLGLFLGGGLLGAACVVLLYAGEPMLVGGASGAICALLVAAALGPGPPRLRLLCAVGAACVAATGLWGLWLGVPAADAAHLGGAAAGLLLRRLGTAR